MHLMLNWIFQWLMATGMFELHYLELEEKIKTQWIIFFLTV
jgi:hypothetical protein